MLRLDLRQLRQKRQKLDETLGPEAGFWSASELKAAGPLQVRLDAQMAGEDVIVRGTVEGSIAMSCRRCLSAVTLPMSEDVVVVFRPGLSRVEAEEAEVYALPAKGDELDLTEAIREQVLLAVPQFVVCESTCRGLCPRCGTNLNETQCACELQPSDSRWAALRRLQSE